MGQSEVTALETNCICTSISQPALYVQNGISLHAVHKEEKGSAAVCWQPMQQGILVLLLLCLLL